MCIPSMDILNIVKCQKSLKLVGIYVCDQIIDDRTLQLLKYLGTIPNSPLLFTIDIASTENNMMGLFPGNLCSRLISRYNSDLHFSWQTITSAIDRDMGEWMPLGRDRILELNLFFESFDNLHVDDFLAKFIADLAHCFPHALNNFDRVISPLKALLCLEISSFSLTSGWDDPKNLINIDEGLRYADEWGKVCQDLDTIRFPRMKSVVKSWSGWRARVD
ncbi:hypothetical protein H0H93_001505 [Arthromyces matolae]|nr:hypothetical protein H0H93_001505 [Arthromyces matolae]